MGYHAGTRRERTESGEHRRAWVQQQLDRANGAPTPAERHAALDALARARVARVSRRAALILLGPCALGLLALADGLGAVAVFCGGAVVTVLSWWIASVGQAAVWTHRAHERIDAYPVLPGASRVVVVGTVVDACAGEHSRSVAGSDTTREAER